MRCKHLVMKIVMKCSYQISGHINSNCKLDKCASCLWVVHGIKLFNFMNVVGCSKQKHKCPQRHFWAGKNVPSHGIILGVALKFMKCQISRAESQDLIWKIKAWFCGLVLLNSLYKTLILHLTRNLSPIWTQKEREQFVTFCICMWWPT